jgi:hypothetical protein
MSIGKTHAMSLGSKYVDDISHAMNAMSQSTWMKFKCNIINQSTWMNFMCNVHARSEVCG